ncbi:SspB family protein [Methylocapsa aurea]|uniref:SspB family protein n=1 Tax=Methylocapsa aurea TaxID=663610 RepID=UPI00055F4F81|nr:ClpXP protease specificity-enhancing factor SspB [Methylocapsa aurea]
MATDLIRYDVLVQDALRGVVRKVLAEAAREGLPGEHHFYISFRTHARGVRLSARMRERYPDEMTIILQHQFWDLSVTDHAFEVGLSFKNVPEMLLIPFDAVTRFSDPSVGFDLKFDPEEELGETGANDAGSAQPSPHLVALDASPSTATNPPDGGEKAKPRESAVRSAEDRDGADAGEAPGEAKVVSIDAFRKKT